ncbi:hypothetical protein PR202_gb04050 [Eleusine coracana subsp. coracana]|uniref:Uncharacterized protein n=1 Tax=Eleusine coracana subsp. coracana TaxID=191504 RepID=A0AAV5E2V0_ELECO|nr:hypothetical protein PR202_gb04050 [Eleusine coracana subsp. coracana]
MAATAKFEINNFIDDYLLGNEFRVVVLEQGERLACDGAVLAEHGRRVLQVGDLHHGADAAGREVQLGQDAALQQLDAPLEEALPLLLVAECLLVEILVLELAIHVVAHGVALLVGPAVEHHLVQLRQAEVGLEEQVDAEALAPQHRGLEHRHGLLHLELSRAQELEQHRVRALVVAHNRHAPDQHGFRRGRLRLGFWRGRHDGRLDRLDRLGRALSLDGLLLGLRFGRLGHWRSLDLLGRRLRVGLLGFCFRGRLSLRLLGRLLRRRLGLDRLLRLDLLHGRLLGLGLLPGRLLRLGIHGGGFILGLRRRRRRRQLELAGDEGGGDQLLELVERLLLRVRQVGHQVALLLERPGARVVSGHRRLIGLLLRLGLLRRRRRGNLRLFFHRRRCRLGHDHLDRGGRGGGGHRWLRLLCHFSKVETVSSLGAQEREREKEEGGIGDVVQGLGFGGTGRERYRGWELCRREAPS